MKTAPVDFVAMRGDRFLLEKVLKDAGAEIKGTSVRCPFHDDKNSSGSIYRGESGAWRFRCHCPTCAVGGDVLDVLQRVSGLNSKGETIKRFRDMLPDGLDSPETPTQKSEPPAPSKPPKVYPDLEALERAAEWSDIEKGCGKIKNRYFYRNPETHVDELIVLRLERPEGKGKAFRQAHPVDGGFVMSKPAGLLPIYNREGIKDADTVVVCEGEKAAEALIGLSLAATTSAGGAGKAGLSDWAPLAGKRVYLWPDADPQNDDGKRAGWSHMLEVSECLQGLQNPPVVYLIDCYKIEDLPPKGDAFDFVEMYSLEEPEHIVSLVVNDVFGKAKLLGPASDLKAAFDDIISGRVYAVQFPWEKLSELTQALMPGTITLMCGSPGATKSFAVLQIMARLMEDAVRAAVLMLEDDQKYHLRRSLAQKVSNGHLTDLKWIKENAEQVDVYYNEQAEWLARFANLIHELPRAIEPNVDSVLAWMQTQAEKGVRVLVVDPLTLMRTGDKFLAEQERWLGESKKLVEKYGLSLLVVSHPKKGAPIHQPELLTLDDVSGIAGLTRASQCVLWLHAHDEKMESVSVQMGYQQLEFNRTLYVLKARNGRGMGKKLAYMFNGHSLTLSELGVIVD